MASAYLEQSVAEIEVIGRHIKVVQKVVGVSLRNIRAIEIQAEEHEPGPDHDTEVDFANNFLEIGET